MHAPIFGLPWAEKQGITLRQPDVFNSKGAGYVMPFECTCMMEGIVLCRHIALVALSAYCN